MKKQSAEQLNHAIQQATEVEFLYDLAVTVIFRSTNDLPDLKAMSVAQLVERLQDGIKRQALRRRRLMAQQISCCEDQTA